MSIETIGWQFSGMGSDIRGGDVSGGVLSTGGCVVSCACGDSSVMGGAVSVGGEDSSVSGGVVEVEISPKPRLIINSKKFPESDFDVPNIRLRKMLSASISETKKSISSDAEKMSVKTTIDVAMNLYIPINVLRPERAGSEESKLSCETLLPIGENGES